jgi:hypothetical protein
VNPLLLYKECILIKNYNEKKERILTAAMEKQQVTYKGKPIRLQQISQQKHEKQGGHGMRY